MPNILSVDKAFVNYFQVSSSLQARIVVFVGTRLLDDNDKLTLENQGKTRSCHQGSYHYWYQGIPYLNIKRLLVFEVIDEKYARGIIKNTPFGLLTS